MEFPEILRTGLLVLVMIIAALIDARTLRIPDFVSLGGMLAALGLDAITGSWSLERVLAGIMSAACLLLVRRVSLSGMGIGDIKLGGFAAYCLGFSRSWYMLAIAAIGGIIFMLATKKTSHRKSAKLPFAPFMALGSIIARLLPSALVTFFPLVS